MSNEGRGNPTIPGMDNRLFEAAMSFVRQHNAIRVGKITKTDYVAGKVQVTFLGEVGLPDVITSHWLPWGTKRANTNRSWIPLEENEQVLVACPHGNINAGVILCSLNQELFPHEAQDALRELMVYDDKEKAFSEYNKADWVFRHYLNPDGTFRFEVCTPQSVADGSSFIMDAEHIQLRVGTTMFTLRDGIIRIQVKGQETEIELTVDHILAHVKKNAILEMTEKTISAELAKEQVRIAMAEEIKAIVKTALIELTAPQLILSVPGSKMTFTANETTLETPFFKGIQASAAAGQYAAGPSPEIDLEVVKPPPELAIGNVPTTPLEP